MARARNIKPGFYKNEDLAECSIWARFIFPGLWMLADRDGRLEDRPKRIKAELLAFDSQDVEPLLAELEARGFLVRYRNQDGSFIQISKFSTHQTPHYSEKKSVIKPPDSGNTPGNTDDDGGSDPRTLSEDSENSPLIKRGSQPPDCLNPDSLNPDSPNPDVPITPLSGSSPDDTPIEGKTSQASQAREVIEFLNAKAGKAFRPQGANFDFVIARLKEGATVEDCRMVIARKFRDWRGTEWEKFMRPETLFNRTKFASYLGECVEPATTP